MIPLMDPAARTRWVRQWNRYRPPGLVLDVVRFSDELLERKVGQKAEHCEATNRNQ